MTSKGEAVFFAESFFDVGDERRADLRHFHGMGQPCAVKVAVAHAEHLRFSLKAAEGRAVNDARKIPFPFRTGFMFTRSIGALTLFPRVGFLHGRCSFFRNTGKISPLFLHVNGV